jgi:hypothetical protein
MFHGAFPSQATLVRVHTVTRLCADLAALWLLRVFPFDFTHLADGLTRELRFMLAWKSAVLGRILPLPQVIVGQLAALFTLGTYLVVQIILSSRRAYLACSPCMMPMASTSHTRISVGRSRCARSTQTPPD